MKRQLITITLLMAIAASVSAQKSDTAQVLVHYKFAHVRDTLNRDHPYTENMGLYIGKNSSVYRSYDNILEQAEAKKQMEVALANSPDGRVNIQRRRRGSGSEYYQLPNEKKLARKEPLVMDTYLIDDALPAMDWKISSDTATFGGLHCQKATTHFKGRDYTAWFCPDMPLHVGPWKLNGLPGVIVQAYDAKKDVQFMFDGVEKVFIVRPDKQEKLNEPRTDGPGPRMIVIGGNDGGDPNIIQLPKNITKTTDKEFGKLQEALRKDPDAFVQSMMAAHNANRPAGSDPMRINIKIAPQPPMNNPIELSDK